MRDVIYALGWALFGAACLSLYQRLVAMYRLDRLAKQRAATYERLRRERAPQGMPDADQSRTYPTLPLIDGSGPTEDASQVTRRVA